MKKTASELKKALKASVTGRPLLLTVAGASLTYLFIAVYTFPTYSYQLLGRSLRYLPNVLWMNSLNIMDSTGTVGLTLTILYAALTGITLSHVYQSIKNTGISSSKNLGAVIPGLLVSGCASCGVGLLTIVGLSGVITAIPYGSNLVKAGGILLMVGLLANTGDPKTCTIPSE